MENYRTIVIGGGLAGLSCAHTLAQAGQDVVVLEAAGTVGGRVRTERVEHDGGTYLVDRGFQVLLDSYPALGKVVDVEHLGLRPFASGAKLFGEAGTRTLADPRRHPLEALVAALRGQMRVGDAAAALRLVRDAKHGSLDQLWQRDESSTREHVQRLGVSAELIDGFFRAFFGGVFFDRSLETSSSMFAFCFRMFSQGRATLPDEGMGKLPKLIAAGLPAGSVRTGCAVERLEQDGVLLRSGEVVKGDRVVFAVDGTAAGLLLGERANEATFGVRQDVTWRETVTIAFAADEDPGVGAWLALDEAGDGPVNHVAVPSAVQSGYAPAGRSLVYANTAGAGAMHDGELIDSAKVQLAGWFGDAVQRWEPIRVVRVAKALPVQRAGWFKHRPLAVHAWGDGVGLPVVCCGDYLADASINGAIESGIAGAKLVLEAS